MIILDDSNTLRKQLLEGFEFDSQLGDTLLLEEAIKAMADEKQPIVVNVHNHPGEPPVVNVEPAQVTVNVPEQKAPQVTVINEDKKGKAQEDFNKTLRKIAKG